VLSTAGSGRVAASLRLRHGARARTRGAGGRGKGSARAGGYAGLSWSGAARGAGG
jgi:hypothetical protein